MWLFGVSVKPRTLYPVAVLKKAQIGVGRVLGFGERKCVRRVSGVAFYQGRRFLEFFWLVMMIDIRKIDYVLLPLETRANECDTA